MSVYTVHESPLRATAVRPDPERFAFVRDGFSFWAFLLAPVWMLWHRMWLVLAGYVVISAALEASVRALGASTVAVAIIGALISLLVGLEAGTLRRLTLTRRGWKNVGVISGHDREDAERRFFDVWIRQATVDHETPPPVPPPLPRSAPSASAPPFPRTPDIIGLFPQPGGQR
jgi:hypothetical protein